MDTPSAWKDEVEQYGGGVKTHAVHEMRDEALHACRRGVRQPSAGETGAHRGLHDEQRRDQGGKPYKQGGAACRKRPRGMHANQRPMRR